MFRASPAQNRRRSLPGKASLGVDQVGLEGSAPRRRSGEGRGFQGQGRQGFAAGAGSGAACWSRKLPCRRQRC